MYKSIKKHQRLIFLVILVLLPTFYISYLSSYNFDIKNLDLVYNPIIESHEKFWLSFSAIATFLGILSALFKENIFDFLHKPNLRIEINDNGTIFEIGKDINLIYHIKVINDNNFLVKNVDFYYESIKINDSINILDVRRPMTWARSEENRKKISIIDYDHLDFIYAYFDLANESVSYRFQINGCYPKSLIDIDNIQNYSEIIIIPAYDNRSDFKKYTYKIEILEKVRKKFYKSIIAFKKRILEEIENLISIQNSPTYFKEFNDQEFKYLRIIFEDKDDLAIEMRNWSPQKYCGYATNKSCVDYYLIGIFIKKLFYNRDLIIQNSEFKIFDDIPNILKITEIC